MESSDHQEVFARERQQHIARIAEEHGRVLVSDLAVRFGVSSVTIRKDLRVLETEGRVVRAHGGALAPGRSRPERAFEVRERLQHDEKERIGAAAADLVVDGESIALDASTTAFAMARHLKARGRWVHLTVITNGLRIATELADEGMDLARLQVERDVLERLCGSEPFRNTRESHRRRRARSVGALCGRGGHRLSHEDASLAVRVAGRPVLRPSCRLSALCARRSAALEGRRRRRSARFRR